MRERKILQVVVENVFLIQLRAERKQTGTKHAHIHTLKSSHFPHEWKKFSDKKQVIEIRSNIMCRELREQESLTNSLKLK